MTLCPNTSLASLLKRGLALLNVLPQGGGDITFLPHPLCSFAKVLGCERTFTPWRWVLKIKYLPTASGSRLQVGEKSKIKIIALLGAKTRDYILCEKEFKNLCDDVKIATEDGSSGFKGLITDLLKHSLTSNYQLQTTALYTAGPIFMLQEIKKIAKMFKILSFGSLEENIACGLGGCFGCVVKTTQGYKRICKEGPVFNLEEILWE